MRMEQAQAKTGSKDFVVAVLMDLAFVVAVLLSTFSAPSKHEVVQTGIAQPGVTAIASR